jgi:hypothetical protein
MVELLPNTRMSPGSMTIRISSTMLHFAEFIRISCDGHTEKILLMQRVYRAATTRRVPSYFPIRDLTTQPVRACLHIPVLIGPVRNAVMPRPHGWLRIQNLQNNETPKPRHANASSRSVDMISRNYNLNPVSDFRSRS